MRRITHIVIHCTATQPSATVNSIQRYWRENLKWRKPGYHYLISADGNIHTLAPETAVVNGVAGQNATSIHISYIGGVDTDGKTPKDTRTTEQVSAMILLLQAVRKRYPTAIVLGHRDFPGVAKACPSFNVASWLESIKETPTNVSRKMTDQKNN